MRTLRAALLLTALSLPVRAHNGPPFPIIVDKRIGPCIVSLWTHPDIGIGTFWVIVDPPPGRRCSEGPEDTSGGSTDRPAHRREALLGGD